MMRRSRGRRLRNRRLFAAVDGFDLPVEAFRGLLHSIF